MPKQWFYPHQNLKQKRPRKSRPKGGNSRRGLDHKATAKSKKNQAKEVARQERAERASRALEAGRVSA